MKLLLVSFTATLKTFRHMVRYGVSPPKVNGYNNVMIRGFSAAGNLKSGGKTVAEVFGLLEATTEKGLVPDAMAFTSEIGLMFHWLKPDKASKVYCQMIDSGVTPTVDTYKTLVDGYCSYNMADEALVILRDMAERGFSLHASLGSVISALCRVEQLDKAFELKMEMFEKKGILPDNNGYSALILGLYQQGRLSEALDLFREMVRSGVLPDEYTYSLLMDTCRLTGEFSKAFHLHDEMIQKSLTDFVTGFSPFVVTYNALIHGYCFLGRFVEAMGILRGMAEMGLPPDAVSYSTVISWFHRNRELGKAYELKVEMDEKDIWWLDENTRESLMKDLSDVDTYTSVMNDYFAEGKLEMVYKLHNELSESDFLSYSVKYSVLINGLHKKATTRDAKKLLLETIDLACLIIPTYIVHDILIENCSNNDFRSVVGLIKGFLTRDLVYEAARAHDTMLEGNYKLEGAVYNVLIYDHCRSGNVCKAYDMYKEMVHYGFASHMFSVLALIKALYYDGSYHEMSWVIQNTLRSCNLNDSELIEVLNEIDVRKREIDALLDVLAEVAIDGLLLDGVKVHDRFTLSTIIVFLILILRGLQEIFRF
ncbi:pentatricopeptide repeat-containing protein At5g39710-like [Lotus japonicus]|uniref:pentatricopeptide repeat-containing protein At5g39710-like n=1 Tax=Lotus japonicus TaxID=34305 RepID=UPI00258B5E19|nr:pentatricopeptide repeat-containing protein At5g39710-like [Lotus japonicus]